MNRAELLDRAIAAANRAQSKVVVRRRHQTPAPPHDAVRLPDDLLPRRNLVSTTYLHGLGIEVGALHRPLDVPPSATVRYVDRMTVEQLRSQYPELADEPLVDVDIIDNGELLQRMEDASQDFVIANHFIEHCENPLLTLENFLRVLKEGGILYLAIPDKRHTFDIDRPVTDLDHVFLDYTEGPERSRRSHFEEWTLLVDKVTEPAAARKWTAQLLERDYSIHFHVWTLVDMMALLAEAHRRLGLAFDVELVLRNADEAIFVLRKLSSRPG